MTWEDKLTIIEVRIFCTMMRINKHTRIRAPVEAKYVEWMRRVHENSGIIEGRGAVGEGQGWMSLGRMLKELRDLKEVWEELRGKVR